MATIECIKRHFGAGGALIPVGTISDGHADGVFWQAADGKQLEVATPSKDKPKTVKELAEEIAVMTDLAVLEELGKDERAGVQKAVAERLEQLKAGE